MSEAIRPADVQSSGFADYGSQNKAQPDAPSGPDGGPAPGTDSSDFEELTFQMGETQARKKAAQPKQQRVSELRVNAADLRREYSMARMRRIYQIVNGFYSNDSLARSSEEVLEAMIADPDAMESSGKFGKDALSRYIILREALEKAESLPDGEAVKTRLEKEIDRLVEGSGGQVLVGLNTSESLRNFSYKADERDMLREAYYDSIVVGRSILETFERLLNDFGCDQIEHTIATLRAAIVEDMGSPISSIDKFRLFAYHRDLNRIAIIRSLIASLKALIPMFPPLKQQKTLAKTAGKVIRYTENGSPALFNELCVCMAYGDAVDTETDSGKDKVLAIDDRTRRQVDALLRKEIPGFLWADAQSRHKSLDYTGQAAPAA